jgi:hypothetical protein
MALKRCPETFFGASWETWLLSIEGGDVVVVETLFQASLSSLERPTFRLTNVFAGPLGGDVVVSASSEYQDHREG